MGWTGADSEAFALARALEPCGHPPLPSLYFLPERPYRSDVMELPAFASEASVA